MTTYIEQKSWIKRVLGDADESTLDAAMGLHVVDYHKDDPTVAVHTREVNRSSVIKQLERDLKAEQIFRLAANHLSQTHHFIDPNSPNKPSE